MPGLVAFGRRWQVGSDDFVLTGFCDFLIRVIWLIAAIVIYWKHEVNLNSDCEGGFHIRSYLYGVFVFLHLVLLTDIALILNSRSGGIMDTSARKYVPTIIYIRLLLTFFEIGWSVVGTMWIFRNKFSCHAAPEAESLIQRLVTCNWVLLALLLLSFLYSFDSLGSYKYPFVSDSLVDPTVASVWRKRLQFYFYFWRGTKGISREAFEELGGLFAELFEGSDLVPSDVIAGLLVLLVQSEEIKRNARKEYSIKNKALEQIVDTVTDVSPCAIASQDTLSNLCPAPEDWNSLHLIYHYFKYTLGPNGWAMLACIHPNPWRSLWKGSFCCGCLPGRKHPLDVEGDNCCFTHTAAMKGLTQLDNSEIIYANFSNTIFQTPFLVALDHSTKSVVISIRATMTPSDVVTDLAATQIPLNIDGLPESFQAHHGIMKTATNTKKILDDLNVLVKVFATYPEYNLIITGLSLGAGTAAILGLLMRTEYPNLKCYLYSCPGGLLTLDAAQYCESFVVNLIYGDDWIARTTLHSMVGWRDDIIEAITRCRTPKSQILLQSFGWFLGRFPKLEYYDSSYNFATVYKAKRIRFQEPSGVNGIEYNNGNINLSNFRGQTKINSQQPYLRRKVIPNERMYLAGKILYVTETLDFQEGHKNPDYKGKPRWTIRWGERNEFQDILTTPRMILDHIPFRLSKAIKDLINRAKPTTDVQIDLSLNLPVIEASLRN